MRLVAPLVAGLAVAAAVLVLGRGGDEPASQPQRAAAAPAPKGRAVFAELGCGSCHTFRAAGSSGEMAPNLDQVVKRHTRASLRAVITSPPPSIMPRNFAGRMTDAEFDALVAFLKPR